MEERCRERDREARVYQKRDRKTRVSCGSALWPKSTR